MIIVDTSVWIDHLRYKDHHLQHLLIDGEVVCHPLIIGELVCGNLNNRKEIINLLQALPMATEINFQEYLFFVEKHKLFGKGVGYIDIHLLASTKLSQTKLWTLGKRLSAIAVEFGINYKKSR